MDLIKNGKTNWMFLIIVFVVALASGSIMLYDIKTTTLLAEAPSQAMIVGHKKPAQTMPVKPSEVQSQTE